MPPVNATLDARKAATAAWFASLRDRLVAALERLEDEAPPPPEAPDAEPGRFELAPWNRTGADGSPGGGGTMGLLRGRAFEKAGVHVSVVHGRFSEEFAKRMPGAEADPIFWAAGISVICHPWNPHAPTAHMNTRFVSTSKTWFGGGGDLTPLLTDRRRQDDPDARAFHAAYEACCARHPGVADHARFKAWCDEYFRLAHRDEPRGIGGIFYDELNSAGDPAMSGFDADFAFTRDVGQTFLDAYPAIMREHLAKPWGPAEREAQLVQRGRYVEFNLLYDRGTLFGLKTGGNVASILSSMPPTVRWP
ncbi:MAG: oxygen-dependent coproporphyrinogen oxidase [Hyphomicrobiales bacterium]|nr:oxygen-dependent coproporphyrinogen oxidase [Hyphomicrobiales bacterium]MDE2017583.1 oxygen-dependent coproporphyrinogen oxidase [Hyphomicrobiales bacterium]